MESGQIDHIIATWDDDLAQHEPFLVCEDCGAKLCSVEEGDSFAILLATVSDHVCEPDQQPRGDLNMATQLLHLEDQIIEYAAIIREATGDLLAPNWTADLIDGGMNPSHLRTMAQRWREFEFEPQDFATRVEQLADAVERDDG